MAASRTFQMKMPLLAVAPQILVLVTISLDLFGLAQQTKFDDDIIVIDDEEIETNDVKL